MVRYCWAHVALLCSDWTTHLVGQPRRSLPVSRVVHSRLKWIYIFIKDSFYWVTLNIEMCSDRESKINWISCSSSSFMFNTTVVGEVMYILVILWTFALHRMWCNYRDVIYMCQTSHFWALSTWRIFWPKWFWRQQEFLLRFCIKAIRQQLSFVTVWCGMKLKGCQACQGHIF